MPIAPEFSSLLISRPKSGASIVSKLRGLAFAAALYGSGLAALILAPFLMLDSMHPSRAGINPDDPPIRLDIRKLRGGPRIRQGVPNGRREKHPASAMGLRQTRPVQRRTDTPLAPPESEIPSSPTPGGGSLGPDGTPGDPNGDGDTPTGSPDGDCLECPGIGTGGPDGTDEPFEQWTPGLIVPSLVPGTRALPAYPDLARRAGLQGTVILLVVVEADGTIGEIEVIKSPDQRWGFDLAAINAVKRWRYRPALMNDRPVAAYIQVMVEFSLAR